MKKLLFTFALFISFTSFSQLAGKKMITVFIPNTVQKFIPVDDIMIYEFTDHTMSVYPLGITDKVNKSVYSINGSKLVIVPDGSKKAYTLTYLKLDNNIYRFTMPDATYVYCAPY